MATSAEVVFYLFDEDLTLVDQLGLTGTWTEGPGIAALPNKHAMPSMTNLYTVPLDIMRSVGQQNNVLTWQLAHVGADLQDTSIVQVNVSSLFEGCLIGASGLPLALIVDGLRLQFQLGPPAYDLSNTYFEVDPSQFLAIPYGASLYQGNAAYAAPNRPGAFLLDDNRLWPVSCPQIISDNGSQLQSITDAQYDSYALGPPLYCIQ